VNLYNVIEGNVNDFLQSKEVSLPECYRQLAALSSLYTETLKQTYYSPSPTTKNSGTPNINVQSQLKSPISVPLPREEDLTLGPTASILGLPQAQFLPHSESTSKKITRVTPNPTQGNIDPEWKASQRDTAQKVFSANKRGLFVAPDPEFDSSNNSSRIPSFSSNPPKRMRGRPPNRRNSGVGNGHVPNMVPFLPLNGLVQSPLGFS